MTGTPDAPALAFLRALWAQTEGAPNDPRLRVFGEARIEIAPAFEDSARRVRISDLVSSQAGAGRAAMALLCRLADAHGVVLDLTLHAYVAGRMDTPALVAWCTRHGFRQTGGSEAEGVDMERRPKMAAAPLAGTFRRTT